MIAVYVFAVIGALTVICFGLLVAWAAYCGLMEQREARARRARRPERDRVELTEDEQRAWARLKEDIR